MKKYPTTGAAQKLLKALDNNFTLLEIKIDSDNEKNPSLHCHADVLQQWAQFLMWRNGFDWHALNTEESRPREQMVESVEAVVNDDNLSDVNKLSATFSLVLSNPLLLPVEENNNLPTNALIDENNDLPTSAVIDENNDLP